MADEHDEALEEVDGPTDSERLQKVHARALRRFDETVIPQIPVRAEALAARRFIAIPGAMWEGDWGDQFANSIRVEIDKVSRGVEKIVNDYRQNRIVPDFRPAGGESDQSTADTLDGLHRADSYHFKAQQARDNAFEEAAAGGFGAYRLTNEWADPYDKDSDHQRINPAMLIADADQRVFFDGNSKLYDKRDARFAFVITADTRGAFEEAYPDKAVSWPNPREPLSAYADWYQPDVVLKCEYYEVEDRDEKLLVLTHKLSGEEQRLWETQLTPAELTEMRQKGWTSRSRTVKRRRVHKYLMSGAEVLKDQGLIAGSCIPVVPVYGKRWYVENQERFRGHVSKRMDAQRLYNAKVSKLSETDALAPREKPIFLAEQMPHHLAELWKNQELERHPYALVNPVIDADGKYVAMGPIGKIDPPQVSQVTALLLQAANADLTDEDQNADEVKANVSADAMDIAATRVDEKSGLYLDNMRQSVEREGEIYLDMAKEVYCEEGRTVETMSEEGDDGEAVLHQPYTDQQGKHQAINDFASGKYKVIASVTEATATRRDKTVRSSLHIATVAQASQDPELAQVAILTAVMNMDGEGMSDFQKYARKKLVLQGIVEPTDDEKQQMQQAAEQQEPDPTAALATAKAADLQAGAQLKGAKAGEAQASALLKVAQAHEIGGPSSEPQVPTGLHVAESVAKIEKTAAETEHLRTTTAHLPQQLEIEGHNAVTNRLKATAANDRPLIRRGNEVGAA